MQQQQRLALLTFFALQLFTTTCQSDTDEDLRALLSFKSFIAKDPTSVLSSWNTTLGNNTSSNGTSGFCGWKGVTCGGGGQRSAGRVTSLRLRGLGLAGTIAPHLGNLTHLRALDLSDNELGGEIPPGLANCLALRSINLSTNSLSGTVPPAMGRLSELAVLNVRSNSISGLIPSSFANLTALTMLSVANNSLHGRIPPWLGNLTALLDLNIGSNMMSGHIPAALSKLANLQHLILSGNSLEGAIHPSLFNLSSLEVFKVGSNQLSGSFPPDVGFTLPNLREFVVFYNRFEGQIPASLGNISTLEKFILHGNRFRGRIPPNCANGLLRVFEVGNNELQATEPKDWDFLASLVNCSSLIYINLQLNNLSGILPSSVSNLSQELQSIRLGGNQIAGRIPAAIGRYHRLTSLEFADNLFTGAIPSDIGKLSDLHELLLFQNRFSGEIPSSLGNITQLNLFLLNSNHLEGGIPASLGNLSKLTSLDISNNRLNGQIRQEVISISSLTGLCNLSGNALSGPIPPQIGQLVNLGTIDLSSNDLSGEIPNSLGSCHALQFLHLQHNLLQGQLPKGLSELRGLQVLDLSDNKLSGPIPKFLESFQLLQSLNLSFNQLSGPVPSTGIFSNASAVSLAGNGLLCGGPPSFQFPACPSLASDGSSGPQLRPMILIFSVVGAFVLSVVICTVACCCLKKLRSDQGDANLDRQESTFLRLIYQRISYAELYVATDSFSTENLIGRGSYSSVYKGTLACNNAHTIDVAVKVLDLQRQGASQSFMSECDALKRIRHRKLVRVITVCDSLDHNGNEFKALVLEFVPNGSLDNWLHPSTGSTRTLSLMQRLNIALDVAEALEYLHNHIDPSIVHCDIKPSNILFDDGMTAHVGDFGLSKMVDAEASRQCLGNSSSVGIKGTIGYVAPEYGMGAEISTDGDVFSYGVLLLEILTGRRPTDVSFHGATSLAKFVEMAYPDRLLEIMDTTTPPPHDGNAQDTIDLYIAPVAILGLACCRDSARQRMKMAEVVKELNAVKEACERKFSPFVDP